MVRFEAASIGLSESYVDVVKRHRQQSSTTVVASKIAIVTRDAVTVTLYGTFFRR